jgi:uncharacterized surface protein with fasciclin (FAS1) repeats
MLVVTWMRWLLAVAVMSLAAGCGGDDDAPPAAPQGPQSLLPTLLADARFTRLGALLNLSGRANELAQRQGMTLFAPTNEAIDAALAELGLSQDELLADPEFLRELLGYHLPELEGAELRGADLKPGRAVVTGPGLGFFKVDQVDGRLAIIDSSNRRAHIIQADIAASNGVIHALDKVLLPGRLSIAETLAARPEFSILREAASRIGMNLDVFATDTVIAPTDEAFNAFFAQAGVTLEQFVNLPMAFHVLRYHIPTNPNTRDGPLLLDVLSQGAPIGTFQGGTFLVSTDRVITDAQGRSIALAQADLLARNGAIHVLTTGLMLPVNATVPVLPSP